MGSLQLPVAVKTVGGDERTLFHLVEDVLHVDESPLFQIHIHSGTQELFRQHRNIETVGVVSRQVAPLHVGGERLGYLLETGFVLHVVIGNAVYCGRFRRYGHPRIDAPCLHLLATVGLHFHQRNLHDSVFGRVYPRGLQIEENYRSLQFQFHRRAPYALMSMGMSIISVSLACTSS